MSTTAWFHCLSTDDRRVVLVHLQEMTDGLVKTNRTHAAGLFLTMLGEMSADHGLIEADGEAPAIEVAAGASEPPPDLVP